MASAHTRMPAPNAALPKLNWLAVLGVMTAAALVIYVVTSTLTNRIEAGRPKPAPAAAPAP
jgi:hypothetical protein